MKIEIRSILPPARPSQADGQGLPRLAQTQRALRDPGREERAHEAMPLPQELLEGPGFKGGLGPEANDPNPQRSGGKGAGHSHGDLLLTMINKMGGAGAMSEKGRYIDLHV